MLTQFNRNTESKCLFNFSLHFMETQSKPKAFSKQFPCLSVGLLCDEERLVSTINYPCRWKSHFIWTLKLSQTTYIRYSEEVKLQHAWYSPFNVIPVGTIVSQPVPSVFAHPREGRAGKDHGTAVVKHFSRRPGSRSAILELKGMLAPE